MLSNIHLRGIDSQFMTKLKKAADKENLSMNKFILAVLRENVGLSTERRGTTYHDLDKLAGTWNAQEAKAFLRAVADFEHIDKDIWK